MLGYTMERTPELPASDTLAALINDGTATDFVSTNLVSVGLIKPENVGKLQLGLLPAVPREKLAEVLANKDNKDKPAFSLVPVGELTNSVLCWVACCLPACRGFRVLSASACTLQSCPFCVQLASISRVASCRVSPQPQAPCHCAAPAAWQCQCRTHLEAVTDGIQNRSVVHNRIMKLLLVAATS